MDDWLEQRLKGEAKRRWWLWLLGGGLVTAGPILGIVLIVIVAAVFLGGFGSGIPGPVTGTSPPMGTSTARAIEWLPAVDASAPGLPNALGLAVIAQASGGAVYGDRSYCVQGTQEQSSGLRCRSALGHGWKNLGESYGLTGINGKDVTLPSHASGKSPHTVRWNVSIGLGRLAHTLATDPVLHTALSRFHRETQTPPGWVSSGYAVTIRPDLASYRHAQMAAWAMAPWSASRYADPNGERDWIFVVAAAPVGPAWTIEWAPPTTVCSPVRNTGTVGETVTKSGKGKKPTPTKTVTTTGTKPVCHVVLHDLTGHALELPVRVYATLKNGHTVGLHDSALDSAVPVWPGGTVFGWQVHLHQVQSVTAEWPGVTDTMPWPPISGQGLGKVRHVPVTKAVAHWWRDIQVASHKTGVPADWIASTMMVESGGQPGAGGNGFAGAFGLMQVEPAIARRLPGYTLGARQHPAENLVLGAELLRENYQIFHSWRLASAGYYGGAGAVEGAGVTPGMSWNQAARRLNVVPAPGAGNVDTLAQYVEIVASTARVVAQFHR